MSNKFSEGISVESLDDDQTYRKFISHQKEYTGLVRFKPSNTVMPKTFCNYQKRIREFQVRQDDVWICTFPKCGTTWTQEMVWCIMNDLDFETAKSTEVDTRVPFVEYVAIRDPANIPIEFQPNDTIALAEAIPSPRVLKTHLTVDLLPKGILGDTSTNVKLIYVVRNPRDVCISLHNHLQNVHGYTGTLEELVDNFLDDMTPYYGPFLDHVADYWKVGKEHKMLFLTYEEMKSDLGKVLDKVCDFLERGRLDESKKTQLLDHLSFQRMRDNDAVNKAEFVATFSKLFRGGEAEKKENKPRFIHTGKSGRWRECFSPEVVHRFEEWERKGLQGINDFKFTYD